MLTQILSSLHEILYTVLGGVALTVIGKIIYDNYRLGKDEERIQNLKLTEDLQDAKRDVDAAGVDALVSKLDAEYNSDDK